MFVLLAKPVESVAIVSSLGMNCIKITMYVVMAATICEKINGENDMHLKAPPNAIFCVQFLFTYGFQKCKVHVKKSSNREKEWFLYNLQRETFNL